MQSSGTGTLGFLGILGRTNTSSLPAGAAAHGGSQLGAAGMGRPVMKLGHMTVAEHGRMAVAAGLEGTATRTEIEAAAEDSVHGAAGEGAADKPIGTNAAALVQAARDTMVQLGTKGWWDTAS